MAVEEVANPGKRYALQVDSKEHRFGFNPDEQQCLRLFKKCMILNGLLPRHKNVNSLHEIVLSNTSLFMLQDMCDGYLDLTHYYPHANDTTARALFIQMADTVLFMHEYGVVHGDLTSYTVLFSAEPHSDSIDCKITGFGLAVYYPGTATKRQSNFHESSWIDNKYVSPGSLNVPYTRVGDVRALGKILYQMLVNNPDLDNIPANGQLQPDFKPWVRDAALSLLRIIGPRGYGPASDYDLTTMQEIVRHPWLKLPPPGPGLANSKELDRLMVRYRSDWSVLERIFVDPKVTPKYLRAEFDLRLWYRNLRPAWCGNRSLDVVDHRDHSDRRYAIKIVRRLRRGGNPSTSAAPPVNPLSLYNELMIQLKALPTHENIVDLADVFLNKDFIMMIRPAEEGATLEDFFPLARDDNGRRVFRQLSNAIRFMHSFGVVHMSLHCDNVVFDATDSCFLRPKLIDINKALWIPNLVTSDANNFDPTSYITPELMLMTSEADAKAETDVRALGRILFAMMLGKWVSTAHIRQADPGVHRVPRPGLFSELANDLLERIGPYPYGPDDWMQTLTIEEVCDHPWLQGTT